MSKNDDRENAPDIDEPDTEARVLGPGADGDVENPAAGLDAPVALTPVGSEPVDGGVVADAPTPAEAEPTATTNEGE
jgi:hypothetical protein